MELFLLLDCQQFAFTFYCFAVRARENGTRMEIRLKLGNGKQWELTACDWEGTRMQKSLPVISSGKSRSADNQ